MRRSFLAFLAVLCAPVSAALQGPSFQSRKQAPRLPALTRLSGGGGAVAKDGRGNGVDPAELADFVAWFDKNSKGYAKPSYFLIEIEKVWGPVVMSVASKIFFHKKMKFSQESNET